jgi:small-conductance mechanosensitive channel
MRLQVSTLVAVLLAAAWFCGGCAAPSGSSAAPKPGQGIAEYRQVARDAHQAVAATVKSLETLAVLPTQTAVPSSALARFDKSFNQLELTSVKARARAEAIIARGQAYFDEWKGRLAGVTNQTTAQAETDRYDRLFAYFERVRQQSGEVRAEFRPFMARLREFRAQLDRSPQPTGDASPLTVIDGLTANGHRVLQALESVAKTLDEAEAALHATLAAKR